MSEKVLSVIIPVYKTEKWLRRCLDSILCQSYKDMEIICVDDGSLDGCALILQEYKKKDSRITVLKHEHNRGLFRARVTGMLAASGRYIAFVDSDDYLSCDWFRPLILKLEEQGADMCLGNTVNVNEKGEKTYYNYYRSFNRNRKTLYSPELASDFFAQAGECFIWHTVWNKVYSAELIERALPYFEAMPEPLVMGEDIAFSSVFYSLANSLAFCDNDCYFYFRHSEASTSVTLPKNKIVKNLSDIVRVFNFIKKFLVDINKFADLQADYEKFKNKYYIIWSGNIQAAGCANDGDVKRLFFEGFGKATLAVPSEEEFYFYEASTAWDDGLEKIKNSILSEYAEYISFDVFDTLIQRPIWEPSDIFLLMENECLEIPAWFSEVRKLSEHNCRKLKHIADRKVEDITLSDIYAYMVKEFNISEQTAEMLMAKELDFELNLCYSRNAGQELYQLAIAAGKKIILISDMYLGSDVIAAILSRCGYLKYEKLFVSSDYKKLKATKSLYNAVTDALNTSSSHILHIGDSLQNDVEMARAAGFDTAYLPKATDVFCNRISSIYTGDAFKDIYCGNNFLFDSREFIKQLPLRCAAAVVATKMFDNPFRSFNHKSMYNADPYYVGYMALGMHVWGVAKWIYDSAVQNGYSTIIFLARDGYIIKHAFDTISATAAATGGQFIASEYFCATRRALFPFAINKPEDLLNLVEMTDYRNQTPAEILDWFADCCDDITPEIAEEYLNSGIELEQKFSSLADFVRFLEKMAHLSLNLKKNEAHRAEVAAAFAKKFSGRCATFDIGYSGRLQAIISNLAGRPVDVFFIHDNGYRPDKIATAHHYNKHCFYNFSPYVSGVVREIFLSEQTPSCVGYCVKDGELSYIYDKNHPVSYGERYAINELQRGTLDFCADMTKFFGRSMQKFSCRHTEVSVAFENFFINATDFDFAAFSNTWIEDKLFGGYDKRSLYQTLLWYSRETPSNNKAVASKTSQLIAKSMIGRAVFYLLYDRKTFIKKLKNKLHINKRK